MKIINIFIHILVIFAFLTIGSLMIIVFLQVLTMEDALLKVQELYENPWQSAKMGATGVVFILAGLYFSRVLVKELRPNDDVVLYGKWGPVSISLGAINSLIRRVLRKFEVVRDVKVITDVEGNHLKIVAQLSVTEGWNVQELMHTIQKELGDRVQKILGGDIDLEVAVTVARILDEAAPAAGKMLGGDRT